MKQLKNIDGGLVEGALPKLRILGRMAPVAPRQNDVVIRGVIGYNGLIREVIKQSSPEEPSEDQMKQSELEKQDDLFQQRILESLNMARNFVRKRQFREAISLFEEMEKKGFSEGKYYKGMVMMAENHQHFFTGLQSMVEACSETMNETLLENMLKLLELAQKAGLFRKGNELKYNVDRNQLGNFLQMYLESCRDVHQQKFAAAKLLEALRQYYK